MVYVFWISLLFVLYTYLGYPLIIVLWSKLFPKPVRLNMKSFEWPSVTMIIIAYNEEKNIMRKIENCRELDYPKELLEICIVSDGSTDGTNDTLIVQPDIRVIIDDTNRGKPHQINRAVAETESDIIVFADARQTFEKNAIKMLVRNFSDPKIGAVSGELVFVSPEDDTERSIGLYWKYEKILRRSESVVDSTFGVTGAIYAIYRELFAPIPDDTILDDVEIPLNAFRAGYRVIFEPGAKAFDTHHKEINTEFRRKTRTLAGNYQLFSLNLWLLLPWKNRLFVQTISHKLFRLLVPWAMLAVLLTTARLEEMVFTVVFWAQAVVYLLGFAAIRSEGLRKIRLVNFIMTFLTLNAAAAAGLYKHMMGTVSVRWKNIHDKS